MEKIFVAIASIGRPSLIVTLRSLAALPERENSTLEILIADDSRNGAVAELLAKHPVKDLKIRILGVHSGNISTARNALLDAAKGDWLIFVDDDEWVEPDWLERLFACQEDFDADVVIGPVRPEYPEDAPGWIRKANPLYHDWGHRGKRLQTGRGGNTLVRTGLIRELNLRFDEVYGRTGGEDTQFFATAATRGARIFATDDAIAHEHVPPERLTTAYILSRAVRSGQSYAQMRLNTRHGFVWRSIFAADAFLKYCVAGLLAISTRLFDRARSFRMRQKAALNAGKLRAVLDLPLAELYRRPD